MSDAANKDVAKKRKAPAHAWKPGQSGNPNGRPKIVIEVQQLARQYTTEAVDTLKSIAKTGKSESARVMAANSLLERGWGKPVQPTEISGPDKGAIQIERVEDDRVPVDGYLAEFAKPVQKVQH